MSASAFEGYVDTLRPSLVEGWVWRRGSDAPAMVRVLAGGRPVAATLADIFRADLLAAGKGSGRHGFRVALEMPVDPSSLSVVVDGCDIPLPSAQPEVSGSPAAPVGVPLAVRPAPPLATALPVPGGNRLLLDISDVIFYLRHHKTVSGIQRVQVELIRYVLAELPDSDVAFCLTTPECERYWTVPREALATLVTHLTASHLVAFDDWRRYIETAFDPARFAELSAAAGDRLVVTGAFWVFPNVPRLVAATKAKGVRIAVYVYDLIPIYEPEFCEQNLVAEFGAAFDRISYLADTILTISEFSAEQVRRYYRDAGRPAIPVEAVPLAHETLSAADPGTAAISERVRRLCAEPFVLCVGTIEVRKNHLYLFRLWQELLARRAAGEVPRLVLVGRRGWRVEDLMAQMEATRYLDGRIVVLEGLSDLELDALYRACLFTAFPSLSEGWGLPVGESLVHGKVCVASDRASIPEVGGDRVVYIDPLNVRDGLAKVEALIAAPDRLRQAEDRIRGFRKRTWTEVARRFFTALEPLASAPAAAASSRICLPTGQRLAAARRRAERGNRPGLPVDLALIDGWHATEEWGVWAKGERSEIAFAVDRPADTRDTAPQPYRIALEVRLPDWIEQARIAVTVCDGVAKTFVMQGGVGDLLTVACVPRISGGRADFQVVLETELTGRRPDWENRTLGLGLVALSVVRSDDVAGRLDVFEEHSLALLRYGQAKGRPAA